MYTQEEAQRAVIGYLFYKAELSDFYIARNRLRSKYFYNPLKALWNLLNLYYKDSGGLLKVKQLRRFLRAKKVSEDRIFLLEKAVDDLKEVSDDVDKAEFVWYVGRVEELYKEYKFSKLLEEADKTLAEGSFGKAKNYVLKELANLEGASIDEAQEGELEEDIGNFIEEVAKAKSKAAQFRPINFGIPKLDNEILGLEGGELCLIAGGPGCGKTTLLVNIAVHLILNQKKNVVYVTTETKRSQLRRRIYSRLTVESLFKTPITTKKFKSGDLSEEERKTLLQLKEFLKKGDHGRLMLVQAPAKATMDWLSGKLLEYETRFKVDVVLLDDIRNMVPTIRRRADFAEKADLMKGAKTIARTHANRGVPVISPHHLTREELKQAQERPRGERRASLSGLASTSEAERLSDVIFALWADTDSPNDIKGEVLKLRDGNANIVFKLKADFAHQHMYEFGSEVLEEFD